LTKGRYRDIVEYEVSIYWKTCGINTSHISTALQRAGIMQRCTTRETIMALENTKMREKYK
jgi:hypothetical protein